MVIGGLHKLSLIDFPGKIAAVVFTYGCNFDCTYCHNTLMKKGLPKESDELIVGQISQEEIFAFLGERQNLLDGVCISGGEPTLHQDLPDFIKKIRNLGFNVKLDTNGTNPEMLKKLLTEKLIDYVAMDIKAPLTNQTYQKVTNREMDKFLPKIRESVNLLITSGIDYEFRTTTDKKVLNPDQVLEIIKEIKGARRYFLQNVVKHEELLVEVISYQPEELNYLAKIITAHGTPCQLRNV